MDAVVSRLHQVLVEALRRSRPEHEDQPITVAEIYQELVPYKHVRAALGVEMNADYEYALLRLLAGEGGFARLEPAEVREALRLEVASPNPNVALYRQFAPCEVWLNMEVAREHAARSPFVYSEIEKAAPPAVAQQAVASVWLDGTPASVCVYCSEPLPSDRTVNFCPYCGGDQRSLQCTTCGEVLESDWRFCPACGATVANGGSAATA
jgi:RNA polymerase subunit RPABC4/transcription elongation factor Spt4